MLLFNDFLPLIFTDIFTACTGRTLEREGGKHRDPEKQPQPTPLCQTLKFLNVSAFFLVSIAWYKKLCKETKAPNTLLANQNASKVEPSSTPHLPIPWWVHWFCFAVFFWSNVKAPVMSVAEQLQPAGPIGRHMPWWRLLLAHYCLLSGLKPRRRNLQSCLIQHFCFVGTGSLSVRGTCSFPWWSQDRCSQMR